VADIRSYISIVPSRVPTANRWVNELNEIMGYLRTRSYTRVVACFRHALRKKSTFGFKLRTTVSTKTGKAAVQQWCQEITGEQITDFTTCFESGVVFLKIISHFRPDLVDGSKIDTKKRCKS